MEACTGPAQVSAFDAPPATGLLRVVPASEAAAARRVARWDFCSRFESAMGHPVPAQEVERWWPE